MKRSIQLFTCLFVFISFCTQAQQNSQSSYKYRTGQHQCNSTSSVRTIELDKSSNKKDIKIDVTDNAKAMSVAVNSTINSGLLTIEIYDPNGDKKGHFSIEAAGDKTELVSGQMQKHFETPMKGDWVVKLIPKKVSGDISICTSTNQ